MVKEGPRQDAHDLERVAIEHHGLAAGDRVAAKAPSPQRIAQHQDILAPRPAVFREKGTAQRRRRAQHG